jgi:site-specific DNA-adenine methylase
MHNELSRTDKEIRARLREYTEADREFWSFRTGGSRGHINSIFQYPAMMVPRMQEQLINTIVDVVPHTNRLFEPFVGAGTVMLGAMQNCLDFTGQDINPLAILLCQAKSGPFFCDALRQSIKEVIALIESDKKTNVEADFPGLNKWFKKDVAIELSRIRRSIQKEPQLWYRRFFWVALAETVRVTSNSRTTTFKLHKRSSEELRGAHVSPVKVFIDLLQSNFKRFEFQKRSLTEKGALKKGRYVGNIRLKLSDTSNASLEAGEKDKTRYDLLVTSPPYGDNKTTVPYGQHSFLPLQWIDLADISEDLDERWISSTHEIDSRSLGGSLKKALNNQLVFEKSISLRSIVKELKILSTDGPCRVMAFWRDLDRCLQHILKVMKPGAYMIWTVGNRRVAGLPIPMDKILKELLTTYGAGFVDCFKRPIPTKRMARRNNFASTMCSEKVLIFRTEVTADRCELINTRSTH